MTSEYIIRILLSKRIMKRISIIKKKVIYVLLAKFQEMLLTVLTFAARLITDVKNTTICSFTSMCFCCVNNFLGVASTTLIALCHIQLAIMEILKLFQAAIKVIKQY